jgi:hypothetical protein
MKPGYKTTEFWLSVAAMLLGVLMSAGLFCTNTDTAMQAELCKLAGMATLLLSSLGYTVTRGLTKGAASKADAAASVLSAASAEAPASPK